MDHEKKLSWAREHLTAFENAIDVFVKREPYQLIRKKGAGKRHYTAYLKVVENPDLNDWSLRVGDVVHSLRSALDCLAYSLVEREVGTIDNKTAENIQFLICDAPREFEKRRLRRVGLMSKKAQAVVELLQPYNGKEPGFRHPLSVIRDLANIDKHRHILLTSVVAGKAGVMLSGRPIVGGAAYIGGFTGAFKTGTVIATWQFPERGPEPKVDVKGDLEFGVVFEKGWATPDGGPVGLMRAAHLHIRDVVFPAFKNLA